MTDFLISKTKKNGSGYFLNDYEALLKAILLSESKKQKTIILGVSYALLDFAEKFKTQLQHTIVMETGGMKGRKKEITREELHDQLKKSFGVKTIYSEYGMTELLSQAYSFGEGKYKTTPWMKIMIRDIYDPFAKTQKGKSGGINIIDLANINSCSFIETKDLGIINNDDTFSILGRIDNSDIRGCNLLVI
jgi:hypothetical protein